MNSKNGGHIHINRAMLFVCDPAGKIQAVSAGAADEAAPGISLVHRDCAEIFGAGSAIDRWFREQMREARRHDDYRAETELENGDGPVTVRLESLTGDHQLFGFALQFVPVAHPDEANALRDGDSIVERKQWHEIKNHIGALKLYATFLKRKMPESDERRIVEKIFNGVNSLIGYLDKIRRGDPQ